MATKTTVERYDDLDGSIADETVEFGLDGKEYEIDLTHANAEKVRTLLASYTSAARRTGGRLKARARPPVPAPAPAPQIPTPIEAPAKPPAATGRADPSVLRAWARAQGYEVSDRGRLSTSLQDAWELAGRPTA